MVHALQDAGKHVLGVALAAPNHAVHNVPTVVVEDVSNIVQVTVLVTVMVALTHANIHVQVIVQEDVKDVLGDVEIIVQVLVISVALELATLHVLLDVEPHAKQIALE